MPLTSEGRALTLDLAFSTLPVPRPTQWFVALFTSAPTLTAAGTEPDGGGYTRMALSTARIDNVRRNSAMITFPRPTASWGTITHFGIFDAATGGRYLAFAPLADGARPIFSGDAFSFEVDAVSITVV